MARDRRATSRTAPPSEDVKPAEGFAPTAVLEDDEPTTEEAEGESPEEELARLRAENAALKAARGPSFEGGRKYRVSLKDGPVAVVECAPGEHPFDAFKRVTGVLGSEHAPVITEASASERCGVCDVTGKVPEPRA